MTSEERLNELLPDEQESVDAINGILDCMEYQEQQRTADLLDGIDGKRLTATLDRLRKNHYHLWKVLMELYAHPDRLREWRQAQKPSQEWRKGRQFDDAMRLLRIMLGG